ncbi:HAD family hydrolase [Flavivirga abyssicola]|uniref:HAD family hydrolase n=1 Tax=Flavivirga abyssicola TaxID=3063533 RepID=UPI0026DF1D36|nr:HAD family hydrolase [Flavivirga sp. MEBiC07777]WVK13053.1 HAD family hydrolase [Flavivirga sp. MEBiC07777]
MTTKTNKTVIFDLDDTLYNEIDFLKSAYKDISTKIANDVNTDAESIYNDMLAYYYKNENVFEVVIKKYCTCYSIQDLLRVYRNHQPKLELSKDRRDVLDKLKHENVNMGLLTDGRSVQQRNKIKALQLNTWFSEIIISEEFGSEKPNINNYKHFENVFGIAQYFYIGDNLKKDFITPNKLNWITICLADNGLNIHEQNKALLAKEYLAKYTVANFSQIETIIR